MAQETSIDCLVLVVEDELLIALDLCEKLDELGYGVMGPAQSVGKALRLLETGTPDVALLDENLSGNSVTPVAEALRERHIPFFIVSGYDSPQSNDPALAGARRLPKPASMEAIRQALAEL